MKRLGILFSMAFSFMLLFHSTAYAQENRFSDVGEAHVNRVAIEHLAEVGVLNGYEDGTFQPNKVVNRAEALKVILSSSGINPPSELEETPFSDVSPDQWFAPFIVQAKNLGIVNGNPNGSFNPAASVQRVAFIKMLLETNRFKKEKWEGQKLFNDVPIDAWYTGYMNYAGKAGLLTPSAEGNLYPDKELTRGEVAEILYLMKLILNGKQTQFLVTQAEKHMVQVEKYIAANNVGAALRAAELSYDVTQQAHANVPENMEVLAAAKIGKGYKLLVEAYIAAAKGQNEQATNLLTQVDQTATEAWEADNTVQQIARHLKDRAEEIRVQL